LAKAGSKSCDLANVHGVLSSVCWVVKQCVASNDGHVATAAAAVDNLRFSAGDGTARIATADPEIDCKHGAG
jgi:hypothetical protein